MERVVGLFVLIGTLLLVAGFGYYIYHTAQRKGWFLAKAKYYTTTDTASGLKVGDPVKLWGFEIGKVTRIDTLPDGELFNVYLEFEVREPYFGYIWSGGSFAKVASDGFLGHRAIEVTRGNNYIPTFITWDVNEVTPRDALAGGDLTNKMWAETVIAPKSDHKLAAPPYSPTADSLKAIMAAGVQKVRLADRRSSHKNITYVWEQRSESYQPLTSTNSVYWLPPDEAPAITERLEGVISSVQGALPVILNMTNQLRDILASTAALTSNANHFIAETTPLMSNATVLTANLRDPNGSLGQWLIPADIHANLMTTLTNANGTLTNATTTLASANTNLVAIMTKLNEPMAGLSMMISNLNAQVSVNTNLVTDISTLLVDVDDMIQGLKRHWLFRSAFKTKPTNHPPASSQSPKSFQSPKGRTR